MEIPSEIYCCSESGIAVYNKVRTLQPNESDEKSDSGAYTVFQSERDCIEDGFPYVRKGKYDKYDTFGEYSEQSYLPGVSHRTTYGVSKVCVESHTGSKSKWVICQKCHRKCTDKGSKCRSDQGSIGVHAGCGKHAWVDGKNISHCHECRQTGDDFCFYRCVVVFEFKQFF